MRLRATALSLVLATLELSASSRLFAYRPFVSTDATVAEPGQLELELGYAGFRRSGDRTDLIAPGIVANIGLVKDLELVGEVKGIHRLSGTSRGKQFDVEDSAVSLKWVAHEGALQESGRRPSVAIEASLLLPTAGGQHEPGAQLVGIASGAAGPWRWHINGGGLVKTARSEPGAIWGVIGERYVFGALRAVAEVNGESVRGYRPDTSALVGIIWDLKPPAPLRELSFDVGLRHGVSRAADDWGATAGLTFALPW
jgi:hypothetical protein